MPSPFLTPGSQSQPDTLAILHLRRDQLIPAVLKTYDDENLGYDEGKVVNTRFGSFPHITMIEKPWGSQIVASKVDTGSRGRRPAGDNKKRKADALDSPGPGGVTDEAKQPQQPKAAVAASSGFLHLLAPTPESWTASLPHRTQVVYTPDYSYILHRLRVRPGSTIIEAGAGSGSFTHAAVRAVFNGYPSAAEADAAAAPPAAKKRRLGKVCSFEFHAQRVAKVQEEVHQHGLDGLVEVTHRDVYNDGFLLGDPKTGTSPKANAVFLDLPAPWLALKHLVRDPPPGSESPLDPSSPVYICTFSPCIEQVQRTISALRQLGWLNISMVEVNHHRIEVRRERYGLEAEGRGAITFPKSVEEAVSKLRAVEEKARRFRASKDQDQEGQQSDDEEETTPSEQQKAGDNNEDTTEPSSTKDQQQIPLYKQGRLVHRTEQDLRTHTSYLVFAILPRAWSAEEEKKCRQTWPSRLKADAAPPPPGPKSKKQLKREEKAQRMKQKQQQQKSEAAAAGEGQQGQNAAPTQEGTGDDNLAKDVEMTGA
ncbi:hypothetical protein VTN00DRAFT_6273 [Thermoascus crustaceus]|uniref:uncharacterized protein n=1 Tax=Thermoascus crustaceus TaxID=5088 RepID=UPI003744B167